MADTTTEQKKTRRPRGEGGITALPGDRFSIKLELPRDPDTGERRTKVERQPAGTTRDDARRRLNKLKIELGVHGDLPTGSETVKTWMEYWIENIDKSRPRTRAGYRSKIKYIVAAIGKIRIDALTPNDVRKVEAYIVKPKDKGGLGLSPTSALQAYQVLAKALKDAEREGRVRKNVARLVDPPRKAAPKLAVLSTREAVAVLGGVKEDRLGSRWAAALLTGARQGELLGLEWDRVDFEANIIDLSWQLQRVNWRHGCVDHKAVCARKRGTDCPQRKLDAPADWEYRHLTGGLYLSRPKSKAGWRIIPIEEPLRSILIRRARASVHEPNPHGLVWTADPKRHRNTKTALPLDGSPIDPSRDNAAWHRVLANTMILDGDTWTPVTDVRLHDARHTAVTLMFDLGIAETTIQDIVGQSTIASTRGYRQKSRRLQREALSSVGRALGIELENDDDEGNLAIAQ